EARERVDTPRNDLRNPPRNKRGSGRSIFGKIRCQRDRVVEVGIPASLQVVPGFCSIAIVPREFAKMTVDFAQPRRMRRFVCVLQTPGEFLVCSSSLSKACWKLTMHYTCDPVHDEDLAT